MCYAKPGPRCTSHAKATLVAAIAERDHMMEAIDSPEAKALQKQHWAAHAEWSTAFEAETGERPTHRDSDAWSATQPYEQQYGARAKACHPALMDAQEDYDATPGGIAEMKATLARLEDEHGDRVLTVPQYLNTQGRLAHAQKRRADQLAVYKEVQVALGKAAAPEPVEVEDEAAAAAPPPPCSCIEYRYQSDCSHLNSRIEQARVHYLPTSREASLALHAARSRQRSAMKTYQSMLDQLGLTEAGAAEKLAAAKKHPNFDKAMAAADAANKDEFDAKQAFYATPAGEALLADRAARRVPVHDAGPHFFGGWDTIGRNATEKREQQARRFTEITGLTGEQTGVADDPTPPDLMYGESNRCPEGCADFKWTADCVHTNAAWGNLARVADAFAATPEVRAMRKAMEKAFEPKKPGLLARLTGRR